MSEYKIQNAVVRIHGEPNREALQTATEKFMKKVLKNEKKKNLAQSA